MRYVRFVFVTMCTLITLLAIQKSNAQIVISQVYGGGGNSGATYTNDFVELFNRGTTSVSVSGWSVQYASATGTGNFGSNPVALLSGSLAPGQYYLLQLAGGTTGSPLPTPDATGTANMSGTGGKVALVNSTTGLGCNGGSTPCSPAQLAQIVDLVGWDGANFYETSPAPATSNTTSVSRAGNGCTDTDNNANDFTADTPNPRNTASPLQVCSTPPLFTKQFSPDVITAGGSTTLTFTIDNTANTVAAGSLDFTDNVPAGVVVASPANGSVSCTGGTLTATSGTGVISYTGGILSAGASCTIQVDVTSAAAGLYENTSGDLTSSLGNSGSATATLTVNPPPPAGSYDIYTVNTKTGNVERVTFIDNADEYNPSFAPGGMYIVHDVLTPTSHSLFVTNVSTGVSTPLVGGEGGNDASWSPDSQYIAFDRSVVGDPNLYIVPVGGGTPVIVRANAVDGEWSNNSKRLVFHDVADGSLRTVDLSGGTETTVAAAGVNPSWSPNGKAIAYSDGNNIFTIAVNQAGVPKGTPSQLTSDGSGVYNQQPSWSNNSKTIVFHSNRESGDFDLWTISASGGTPTLLTGNPDYGDYDPCYSKNRNVVAYAGFTVPAPPTAPPLKSGATVANSVVSIPTEFGLMHNYPNPFNPTTTIEYALPTDARVTLVVYDVLGRRVAELVNGYVSAGYHSAEFNASALASGIYFYRMSAEGGDGKPFTQMRKLILMK